MRCNLHVEDSCTIEFRGKEGCESAGRAITYVGQTAGFVTEMLFAFGRENVEEEVRGTKEVEVVNKQYGHWIDTHVTATLTTKKHEGTLFMITKRKPHDCQHFQINPYGYTIHILIQRESSTRKESIHPKRPKPIFFINIP